MKKKKNPKTQPATSGQQNSFDFARKQIRRSSNLRNGLSIYKGSASPDDLRTLLPEFLGYPAYNHLIWPKPFPTFDQGIGNGGLQGHGSFQQELVWNVAALLHHQTKLAEFMLLKRQCEHALLHDNTRTLDELLLEIERKFGASLWLIETKINYLQAKKGFKEQRLFAQGLVNSKSTYLARYLISWISFRAESNVSAPEFYRQLNQLEPPTNSFAHLTHIIVGACPELDAEAASVLLSWTDTLPAVDRHLFTVAILQCLIANDPDNDLLLDTIAGEVQTLANAIDDAALKRVVALAPSTTDGISCEFIDALDAYTIGQYAEAQRLTSNVEYSRTPIETLHVNAKARLRLHPNSNFENQPPDPSSLLSEIGQALEKVLSFSEDASQGSAKLRKTVAVYSNSSWAASIGTILERHENDDRFFSPRPEQIYFALRAEGSNPQLAFSFEEFSGDNSYIDRLAQKHHSSPTIALANAILQGAPENFPSAIPRDRQTVSNAIIHLRNDEPSSALKLLGENVDPEARSFDPELGLLIAEALYRSHQLLDCASLCVKLFLRSSYYAALLPLHRLLKALVEKSERSEDYDPTVYGHLPIVIAFDIYSRFVSTEFDFQRVDAFKDFLAVQGVGAASELASKLDVLGKAQATYFFQFVCVPDVLDQSLNLISTRAVEDERAKILVILSEIAASEGKAPDAAFMDELTAIRTRQVIRDTTRQLDQSKVYVNVEGLRKSVATSMRENWQRYKIISLQYGSILNYEEIHKALEAKLGVKLAERLTVVSMAMPATEKNLLFRGMFQDLLELFSVSKEFGLDANLSTNIRHGFVMRELRGPFVSRHLVTNKQSETGNYQPNQYWLDRLVYADDTKRSAITKALSDFSEAIDAEIEHLNRALIRIRSEQAPNGLFDFNVDDIRLQLLQQKLDQLETFDEFLNGILEFLWTLTDHGLDRVRHVLRERTQAQLNSAISNLQMKLSVLPKDYELSSLISATNLVKPEVASAIERVGSWFTLSQEKEYQDYDLQISFEAALATVKSYYSQLEIVHCFDSANIIMKGRTLPSFTRLFSILLDNCALHSKIAVGELPIDASAKLADDLLYLRVCNPISSTADARELKSIIERINRNFGAEPSAQIIRQEGGSGYPKIWKILKHDLGGEHAVDVSLTDEGRFQVDIMIDAKGLVA